MKKRLAALVAIATCAATGLLSQAHADVSGPVAYVGCSETELSVHGYHVDLGTRFWPQNTKYNGGFLYTWAAQPFSGNQRWIAFNNMNAAQPGAQQVWWQLCIQTGATQAQVDADAETVLAQIHAELPGATVYVSALPDYTDHVCPSTGLDGFALEQYERDRLVNNGEAQAGPVMPPAPSQYTYPSEPCHSNYQGQKQQGQALLEFFG